MGKQGTGEEMRRPLFFGRLANLRKSSAAIRQKFRRIAPLRKLRALFQLATNLPEHLVLQRVLAHPSVVILAESQPNLRFKYLHSNYLARSLSTRCRLKILSSHYRFLQTHLSPEFLMQAYRAGHTLWRDQDEGNTMDIVLTFPKGHDYEGDLRLDFRVGTTPVYTLTFSIIAGALLGMTDGKMAGEQVLLVSGVQGIPGQIAPIRQATKMCHDTSPAYLLLAAAQALALSLDINMIVGLGKKEQVSSREDDFPVAGFVFDYDGFWQSFALGSLPGREGFYRVPLPIPEKPLETMHAKRRGRAMRRREMRKRISDEVGRQIGGRYCSGNEA